MTAPLTGAQGASGPQARWERLAEEVALQVPVPEIDGVWTFQPLRNGPQEAGTAIISRIDGERRRIYTARYVATIKGKQRGLWQSTIEEVGSGPSEALDKLLTDVEKRVDEGPPAPVPVAEWYPDRESTTPDLKTNRKNYIEADPETLRTSKTGVFAGGDIVTGGATVILARGAGRKAARSLNTWLGDGVW